MVYLNLSSTKPAINIIYPEFFTNQITQEASEFSLFLTSSKL